MEPDLIDGFLLAEVLGGPARKGLAASVKAHVDRREVDDRASFARDAARRLRPQPRDWASAPPRIKALLGEAGPAPRRRYRPPPGLADALRRRLAMRPPVDDDRARGAGRSAVAHLDPVIATLDAEEAAAVLALRPHVEGNDGEHWLAIWRTLEVLGCATLETLGRVVLGEGDDTYGRGGRELRELEEVSCLG